jgi:NAD(P)-dependent dehydrogenase (short-subunit alcohol dehydrogenase family)
MERAMSHTFLITDSPSGFGEAAARLFAATDCNVVAYDVPP